MQNHQRKGAESNAAVGKEFEETTREFFKNENLQLNLNVSIPIGVGDNKKEHAFDLGCEEKKILVECKSHKWTEGGNVPSAKMTTWNEAMFYFFLASSEYRKIMFVLRDFSEKRKETLAEYYIRTYSHLICNVEFYEFDEEKKTAKKIN